MKFTLTDRRVFRHAALYAVLGYVLLGGLLQSVAPSYDATATGRRPLVIVNGVTQQLSTSDYVSTAGGLSTSGAAPAAGDIQTTTETVGTETATNQTVTTKLTAQAQVLNTGVITPTAFSTSTANDYNPTGLSTAWEIDQGNAGASTVSGIVAQPTGTILVFHMLETASGTITLVNQSANSSAANRFLFPTGANIILDPGMTITLRYSGSDWRVIGWSIDQLFNLTVVSNATFARVNYSTQTFTTTGTTNNLSLNSTTTILKYTGTADATFTGITGGGTGRILIVENNSGHTLTLSNLSGSSTSTNQFMNNGADVILTGNTSAAVYEYVQAANWHLNGVVSTTINAPTLFSSTTNKGTISLSGGTGTATVTSGAVCVCTDTTAANVVKCAVSSTTLTATGTTTDVIAYHCF